MSTSLTSAILPMTTGSLSSSAPSIPSDIAKMAFPLLFGPLFNWTLYGVLCVQIYVYGYNFPNDRPLVKTIAYFVFAMETVQTILTGADIYYWFVGDFGNVERLKHSHFAPIDMPMIHSIVSFIVQGYLCYRIWTLNGRSSKLCIMIALFTTLQSIGSAWGGISSILAGGKYAVSKAALYLWSVSSAISDILIAIAMVSLYIRTRSNGSMFSNFIMTRLVRLTIETNALTASIAIATFILFIAFPNDLYYVFLVASTGKLYANTLLVSLNNRIYFRDYRDRTLETDTDNNHRVEGAQSRRSAFNSLRFNRVVSPTNVTAVGDSFKLNAVSHIVGLEKSEGDDAIDITLDGKC